MSRFLIFLLLPLLAQSQPCTYLAYESYDYTANTALHNLSGGTGWAEPWVTQGDDKTLPGYQTSTDVGSLNYADLQTMGRYATGGRVYLTAGRRLNTADNGPFGEFVGQNMEGIGTSANGGVLWMSFLLRKEKDNNASVFAGLHGSNIPWCDNCSGEKIEIGYFSDHSDVNGQRRWTLRIGDQYYPSSIPVNVGVTAFFAIKLAFNPNGTGVELYINPSSLGNGTPIPDLAQSSASAFVFRSAVTYLGNDPGNGSVDELRLAAEYRCVAPDASIGVNLPPIAYIQVSDDDGQAPFTITLDGTGSTDPEGAPLTYTWHFGDGAPDAQGPVQTHTYNALGILAVRLTVADPAGQAHSAYYPITVRDQQQTFPCLSSFDLLRQADCSGMDGIIRINDHPEFFSLKNSSGSLLTPVNGNEYQNLPAGAYAYEAHSSAGCSDHFDLQVPMDSNTCAGWQPELCDMAIGTNLSGFADWVSERPLRNLFKHVRPEPIPYDDNCFCWDNGNLSLMSFDADGYPTHIPQIINGIPNKLRYVISTEGANLKPGETYVLLYDGQGNLSVGGGVVVTSNAPGRIQFNVTEIQNMFFVINTSLSGDSVRNVRILRLSDEFADLDAQPFYDGFLEKIRPFKVLRFMDWGATNGNTAVHWSERTQLSHFTYGVRTGVPYEVMIQLANQLKKDVWVCVPHAADSSYVAEMAKLFRDQLDPGLNIYLEYSNEVWNWIFPQSHYNADNAPGNLNYGRAMAMRAGRTFAIWLEVFGAQKSRVKRVLGLQAGYNDLNRQILSQLRQEEWDLGAPSSYIGLDHSSNGNPVLNASSTADDIILNARNAWASFRPLVWQDYNNVKLFGKKIVNYEGGQHFVGNVFGIPYPYQQAMWDAQYSLGIYHLYDDMLDTIRSWGSVMFGNFSLSGAQESIYGSWGVLSDIELQPPFLEKAPKYQALMDNLCPESPTNAVKDASTAGKLLIYPNPAAGIVSAAGLENTAGDLEIIVRDMLGRECLRQKGFSVDLSGLPEGVYTLTVMQGRTMRSGRIVKAN